MADKYVNELPQETYNTLDGTEQFVMFDVAEGKRSTLNTIGNYVLSKMTPDNLDKSVTGTISDMQTDIDTLQLAVGSPLVAETVSNMTDTTKIYVYVGNETGYTAGNWYYWNGTGWVSGGVYNAEAVATDTTLAISGAPADSKATGDALDTKVDKVTGKGLSTEDYTTEEKTKLSGIATGATNVVIDDTLTQSGKAADAKVVGDKIEELKNNSSSIINSASGSIASFTDGADDVPVKNLKFNIEPVQDLHGYDHPWPEGGGKNMLKVTATTQTINGITFTVNDDGTIVVNGTATADASLRLFDGTGDFINCIISGCPSGGTTSTYYAALSNVTITSLVDVGTEQVITIENTGRWIYNITIKNGYTANNLVFKPMIRLASEADSTFAPYSNICPITGWTEIEGVRTGFNVWDEEWEAGYCYVNASGKLVKFNSSSCIRSKNYIPVLPNTVYYGRVASGKFFRVIAFDADKKYINMPVNGNVNTSEGFTTPNNCNYIMFHTDDYGNIYNHDICINFSDPNKNGTYEPYQGTLIPITFPSSAGTVYGGYVNVTEGKLVVDRVYRVLNGSDGSTYDPNGSTSKTSRAIVTIPDKAYGLTNIISSVFHCSWTDTVGEMSGRDSTSSVEFFLPISVAQTTAAIVEWFSENQPQVCYELATPIEYSLTPQQVNSLLGENHIWCDSGETEVEYRADTKLYIDGKIAELQALILENGGN